MTLPALVVPVRDFDTAKSRLSDTMSASDRSSLARLCAERVLDRRADCLRIVVCDTDDVESWSQSLGVECVRVAGSGLNAALDEALPIIRTRHPQSTIVIAHGDLVDPSGLDAVIVADFGDRSAAATNVVIVPDRHLDGTNVLRLDPLASSVWRFEYGPGSFERHRRQARARGLSISEHLDTGLAVDLDVPADLSHPVVRTFLAEHFTQWHSPTAPDFEQPPREKEST